MYIVYDSSPQLLIPVSTAWLTEARIHRSTSYEEREGGLVSCLEGCGGGGCVHHTNREKPSLLFRKGILQILQHSKVCFKHYFSQNKCLGGPNEYPL